MSPNAQRTAANRRKSLRVCPICGAVFAGAKRAIYCSARCKDRAHDQARRARRSRTRSDNRALREMVRLAQAAGLSYGRYVARETQRRAQSGRTRQNQKGRKTK